MALEHASADGERLVVRSAVCNWGAARLAGPCARSCGDIVIEAVARYAPALQWAAPELRPDVWFLVRCGGVREPRTPAMGLRNLHAGGACACVNARLQTHRTFCSTFLLGTIQSPSASMLSLLPRRSDTASRYFWTYRSQRRCESFERMREVSFNLHPGGSRNANEG